MEEPVHRGTNSAESWSQTANPNNSWSFYITMNDNLTPNNSYYRWLGLTLRCVIFYP